MFGRYLVHTVAAFIMLEIMTDIKIPDAYMPLFWWTSKPSPDYRYYDFSGGRSSGKSHTVALALILEAASHPIRVLCAREFQNSIRDSVKKLLEDTIDANILPGFHTTNESISHDNGSQFIFRGLHDTTAQSIKSLEGINRCWVEEAQTITAKSLDILLPTIRVPDSTVIFTRNPLTPDDIITRRYVTDPTPETSRRTYHAHTTWRDLDRLHILPSEVKHQIQEAKGTPEYAHIWEGMPYARTINQIVSWTDLQARVTTPAQLEGGYTLGVDVARYGTDRTAVAINHAGHLESLTSWTHASITDTADRVATIASTLHPLTAIHVDDTGVGGGLTDILVSRRLPVVGINYAQKATRPDLYPNVASELWFRFAEQLPSITINPRLQYLTELFTELTTREWKISTRNQRQVQSKTDYKDDNATHSPDLADAVLLAFYQPAVMPSWSVTI